MNEHHRRPAAFRLDDPHVVTRDQDRARLAHGTVRVMPEPEPFLPVAVEPFTPPRRGFPWSTLFWTAFGGLVVLALGLALARLIEDLFARHETLGWVGIALASAAALALAAIVVREMSGLARLSGIEKLRARAAETLVSDDRAEGRAVVRDLLALARNAPRLARPRAEVEGHLGDIIDGADRVRFAERELMGPLDREATRLVGAAAKRVSVVTAVSPRAAVDMLVVLVTALGVVRRLSRLYGGRPGTLGLIRLIRLVIAHLAFTGGLAAGDSLIQQVVGHGVAAKLSARLGEGVLNGLLTARLGLAAIEVTRPMPFAALPRPTLKDLAGDLARPREENAPTPILSESP